MPKKASLVVVIVLALILSVTTYAFAAANVVPDSHAGDGQGTVSGYTVSAINYTLDSTNPSNISQLSFTIKPTDATANPPATVRVKLGSSWLASGACTVSTTTVTCTGLTVAVTGVTSLQVVAAQ